MNEIKSWTLNYEYEEKNESWYRRIKMKESLAIIHGSQFVILNTFKKILDVVETISVSIIIIIVKLIVEQTGY